MVCCNNTVCGLVYGNGVFGYVNGIDGIVCKYAINSVAIFVVKAVAGRKCKCLLRTCTIFNNDTRWIGVIGEIKSSLGPTYVRAVTFQRTATFGIGNNEVHVALNIKRIEISTFYGVAV